VSGFHALLDTNRHWPKAVIRVPLHRYVPASEA
jgi:hypothetical protein